MSCMRQASTDSQADKALQTKKNTTQHNYLPSPLPSTPMFIHTHILTVLNLNQNSQLISSRQKAKAHQPTMLQSLNAIMLQKLSMVKVSAGPWPGIAPLPVSPMLP
jgi:uncharacterized protein YcbK (DUF882 family)